MYPVGAPANTKGGAATAVTVVTVKVAGVFDAPTKVRTSPGVYPIPLGPKNPCGLTSLSVTVAVAVAVAPVNGKIPISISPTLDTLDTNLARPVRSGVAPPDTLARL